MLLRGCDEIVVSRCRNRVNSCFFVCCLLSLLILFVLVLLLFCLFFKICVDTFCVDTAGEDTIEIFDVGNVHKMSENSNTVAQRNFGKGSFVINVKCQTTGGGVGAVVNLSFDILKP